jgi:SAM-dependent methyltransferase
MSNWDYSALAATYDKRPPYAERALDRMVAAMDLRGGAPVADIGAGTGKLALPLLQRGCRILAVEPNAQMGRRGRRNTEGMTAAWSNGTAEATGLPDRCVQAVFFGSSFNVVDRSQALREAARILMPGGWLACLWNHRCLDDPLQARVESVIHALIPDYRYGVRREDQRPIIEQSGMFGPVSVLEQPFTADTSPADYLDAWRSHATLARQAGTRFEDVIEAIAAELPRTAILSVPYVTRAWYAPLAGR